MTERPETPFVQALIKHRIAAIRVDEAADTEVGYMRLYMTDGWHKLEVNVSEAAGDSPEYVERWAGWMADALLKVKP
jgi:hypothetical protein